MAISHHSSDEPEELYEPSGAFVGSLLEQIDLLLSGGLNGFGLKNRDLVIARKAIGELRRLSSECPRIVRNQQVRDQNARWRAYRDACKQRSVSGPHDDHEYILFKHDRVMALVGGRHRSGTKKLRAEIEALYKPGPEK